MLIRNICFSKFVYVKIVLQIRAVLGVFLGYLLVLGSKSSKRGNVNQWLHLTVALHCEWTRSKLVPHGLGHTSLVFTAREQCWATHLYLGYQPQPSTMSCLPSLVHFISELWLRHTQHCICE